ncbi:MAG: right-handed parallel beta-helix repeat-containing protein, partial [Candidatus Hodarchaeales archaeon]
MRFEQIKLFFAFILALGMIIGIEIQPVQPSTGFHIPINHQSLFKLNSLKFTPHDPISISSDTEFISRGFNGSGTIDDPYRIVGFNITSSSDNLISIGGTTAYFLIANNVLNGLNSASTGIYLLYADHGTVVNNTISHVKGEGILLDRSNKNTIKSNVIHNNERNFLLVSSNNNTVENSIFFNGTRSSVSIINSDQNYVSRNSICYNQDNGLFLNNSRNSQLKENFIYENKNYGLFLAGSSTI